MGAIGAVLLGMLFYMVAAMVGGAVGFAVPYGMFKDRRTYSETQPASNI